MTTATIPNRYSTTTKSGRKNIWSIDQVAPCPHERYHAWVVHVLEGHFDEGDPQFHKATKHKTRAIYARMNENGKLENVFPGGNITDEDD